MSNSIEISSKQSEPIVGLSVAFATNDMENIDAHFGSCQKFIVYSVSREGFEPQKVIKTKEEKNKDGDKTENVISALKGVDIAYFLDIGPIAAAKVIKSKIFPIKYKEVISIESELQKLSQMLSTNPPPFIKKIIESKEVA